MGATLKLEVDLSGWTRNLERVHAAVAAIPVVEIGPRDVANRLKAQSSFDRGDLTYPASDTAQAAGGKSIARGLKAISGGASIESIVGVMDRVGKAVARDVKVQIAAGKVTTDTPRTPAWIKRKGHNINMVGLTGKFVRSLISKIVK